MIKHCLSLFAWLKAWQPQAESLLKLPPGVIPPVVSYVKSHPPVCPVASLAFFSRRSWKANVGTAWEGHPAEAGWPSPTALPAVVSHAWHNFLSASSLYDSPTVKSHSPVCPVESLASWTSTGRSSCILHNDLPILLCQQLFLMSSTTWKVWPLQCKAILLQNADLHVRMLMASRVKTAWRFFVWHREPINRKSHVPLSKQNQKWLFCLTSWTHQ